MKLRTAFIFAVDVMLFGLSAWSQDVPKIEVSADYSYFHFQAIDFESNNNLFQYGQKYGMEGGGGAFVFNLRGRASVGFKAEFQGYGGETRTITIPAGNPFLPAGGSASVSGDVFTYLFGPQITLSKGKFRPFGEVLVGGAYTDIYKNAVNNLNLTGASSAGSNNTFALAAGLGFDIAITRRFAIRPIEIDYVYTDFNNSFGLTANQHSSRYLGGIVFNSEGKPPIPPTASCSVTPTEIWSGDPVTATMSTLNFNPKHTITYTWNANGGKISGTGTTANVDTVGIAPGSYAVTGTATDAKEKKNNIATCSASFTVRQPHPPTAACAASPQSIKGGDGYTVTVTAQSPDNSPLTYSYTTSAGNITGTGNTASGTTSTANANSTITATANIVDARGLTASCTATVTVEPLPVVVPPPPQVSAAGECMFNTANKADRVDNECKAALDDVALRLQRDPSATLVVVGYTDDSEAKKPQLAGQRAVNVKFYLTSGEGGAGIDASRIQVKAGTAKSKSAKMTLVPAGATFTEDTTAVDETQVKGKPRNAPAKKSKAAAK
jgi:flagellar motor protein MotB